jgi:hypothetical protein
MSDYRTMWADLGLDLEAHDGLLAGVKVHVPEDPQIVAAIGCALLASAPLRHADSEMVRSCRG